MNINSSSTGFGGEVERAAAPKQQDTGSEIAAAAQVSQTIPTYTKVEDLKRAEMVGERHTIGDEQLVKAIERAIKAMQGKSTSLEFTIHETNRLIAVKVLDNESGEVIREIPPEKSLDFVAKLWEMAGILIDEKR